MGQDAESKRNLPGRMPSPKDKVFFSSASRSHKLRDRVGAVRSDKPIERLDPDNSTVKANSVGYSCSSKVSRSSILRGRHPAECRGVEELVKYMSEVPAYLQLLEKDNTNQEKALNMGVLDWGHLQKWTNRRRPSKSQLETNVPSTSRNFDCIQQLSLQSNHCSHVEKDCNKWGIRKNTSQKFSDFLKSETVSMDTSRMQQNQRQLHISGLISENRCKSNTNFCREKVDSGTSNGSITSSKEVDTSLSTASKCEIPSSSEVKEKEHGSRLRHNRTQMSLSGPLNFQNESVCTKDGTGHPLAKNSQCFDDMLVYQKDLRDSSPRVSADTAVLGNEMWPPDERQFSGLLLPEDVLFRPSYADVPHSCPLLSSEEDYKWLGTNPVASGNCNGASSDALAFLPQVDVSKTFRFKCNLEKSDEITSQTPKLITAWIADHVPADVMEAVTLKTRESLHPLNLVTRANSHREIHVKNTSVGSGLAEETGGDKATATSRARRSPLRRMLDPLLKPRLSMRCPESAANTPSPFVRRLSFSDKCRPKGESDVKGRRVASPKESISSSLQGARRPTFSAWACESRSALQDEKHERSKMQGLLRLVWKNDSPLLTFSANDTDILAATRKNIYHEMKNAECMYTFYYVQENKQKSGRWMNQGSKIKAQDLATKVIGRMDVSNAYWDTHFSTTEFVLYGTEIRPTASKTPPVLPVSEIAAIVVQYPKESTDISSHALHLNDHCSISESENRCMPVSIRSSIVAILPSEVHGFSEAGGPSPLIQRWKSGGSCDCGGWDVGCSLAILSGNLQGGHTSEVNKFSSCTSGLDRIKLVIQGGSKDSPVFSLVPFNEGIFTVEFDPSISTLQAFSICTAILHTRKASIPSKAPTPLQIFTPDSPLKNHAASHGKAPAMYVPHRPPLSPVGRA